MYKGKITELLGSELPIIQAPMAGVQDSALAIAVCDAGGLGSLPCGMLSADKIVAEIEAIQAATDKPFNLNFFCHEMPEQDARQQQIWRDTLRPYFNELGSEPENHSGGASRLPFSHEIADAIEHYQPRVISFHFGLPKPDLLARVKSWGCAVLSSATTLQEALWLEAHGADAIIAQGAEAGGHRGMFLTNDVTTQLGTFALVPQIAHNVRIPVIAAGGIAGRGIKAAMTLGAEAVQLGTAYMLCSEAKTSPLHRSAISGACAEHTALTNVFSGRPARGIVNRAMRDLNYLSSLAPQFPYASAEMSALRTLAEQQGRDDFTPLWCGQNTSGCIAISASELTLLLATESGMLPIR
ncbi:nitronate monooxygenase [Vibrio fluvialis]|nr:nitronate monooxygenase [Vibrio fluvialis]EKO3511085.1 nitronate monooxygenase [Vibrio fluvialis]